jgi:hypothetical protein
MIIKELKKVSILEIVVLILLIIILLQKCGGNPENPTAPQITRDTVWVHTDSTILSKPQLIKTEPYAVPIDRWNTEYLPDTNYSKLVLQYQELVKELLSINHYRDSLPVDSLGYVIVNDTMSRNTILGRSFDYNFHYPVITNTITIPEPKRTQWYVGGTIQGEQGTIINQINANLLIKNKRDQMFGGHVGLNKSGAIQIGLSSFWKIKLK